MKKIVVLVTLIVLLVSVSAVYADSSDSAWEAQVEVSESQPHLQVAAGSPYDDWNCLTAVRLKPKKCDWIGW